MKNQNSIRALISLIDEPDETAYGMIRSQICTFGPEALPLLENASENYFNPLIRDRIGDLIRDIRKEQLRYDFTNWTTFGSSDLLQGFLLVSRTRYPDLQEEEIRAKIARLRMDIWLELNDNLTALENIRVMNHILFNVHHFDGKWSNSSDPQYFYLNNLLETHQGSPLTLGMLYMILAKQVNLPVYGINLPRHFVLAYLLEHEITSPTAEDVLFYINPMSRGTVFTRREIDLFLRQMKMKQDPSFFTPCTHVEVIRRLLQNMVQLYTRLGDHENLELPETLLGATGSG